MKLLLAWPGHKGEKVLSKTDGVSYYQARWRLLTDDGMKVIERKKTTFTTRAKRDEYLKRLDKAEWGVEKWRFDEHGFPTQAPVVTETVLSALGSYMDSRWATEWQSSQRNRVHGQAMSLVAITLTRPKDRDALLVALEQQRIDRGRRPEPVSVVEWAARWLRDYSFYPKAPITLSESFASGKRWVEQNSMHLSSLDTDTMTRLRKFFTEGKPYATARSYWSSSLVPFFNWLLDTRKVPHSLLAGQPKYSRDKEGERPDPRRIPDPRQLREIAATMGESHGPVWETFVLLTGYCALRMSEALDVRLDSFEKRNGRWWLNIATQEHRAVAACSDTGATKERMRTKSTRRRTPAPRLVPIPNQLLERLEAHYGLTLGTTDVRLFVGPRGGVANASTVREWWNGAIAELFTDNPRLAGIKPHSLRHAGMTYWFAAPNADQKKIQLWGGWTSLTQMLDTYRGVIDSLEEVSLDGLDDFVEQFAATTDADETNNATGNLVQMSEWTRRRGRAV